MRHRTALLPSTKAVSIIALLPVVTFITTEMLLPLSCNSTTNVQIKRNLLLNFSTVSSCSSCKHHLFITIGHLQCYTKTQKYNKTRWHIRRVSDLNKIQSAEPYYYFGSWTITKTAEWRRNQLHHIAEHSKFYLLYD